MYRTIHSADARFGHHVSRRIPLPLRMPCSLSKRSEGEPQNRAESMPEPKHLSSNKHQPDSSEWTDSRLRLAQKSSTTVLFVHTPPMRSHCVKQRNICSVYPMSECSYSVIGLRLDVDGRSNVKCLLQLVSARVFCFPSM